MSKKSMQEYLARVLAELASASDNAEIFLVVYEPKLADGPRVNFCAHGSYDGYMVAAAEMLEGGAERNGVAEQSERLLDLAKRLRNLVNIEDDGIISSEGAGHVH